MKQHNQLWRLFLGKKNYLCLSVIFSKVAGRFTEKNIVLQLFFSGFNNISGAKLQKKYFFENIRFFSKFGEPPNEIIYR